MAQQFFYDEQIRRFLLQFTRIFSNFEVEYGREEDGSFALYRVPVRYGDASRQAQTVLQQNSANSMPATPLMTFYVTGLNYARDRIQEPNFVEKRNVRQRVWDEDTQTYDTTQANAFTIERLMPVPYNLEVQLDIWTSNTNQKLQLLEQILTLFNPSLEIQGTDNFLDWTSLSVVNLERTNWSSRNIPMGTEDPIDISSLAFSMPIWISPPAKIKKLGVVQKIIASMYDPDGDYNEAILNNDLLLGTRQKMTPYNYQTLLIGNQLQVLEHSAVGEEIESLDAPASQPSNLMWHTVVDLYGKLRNGISQVRLVNPYDDSEIVGTVAFHPSDDRFLLFTVDEDTIPSNTLDPVNSIVDPLRKGPGAGLPAAAQGQRYLFIESTGSSDGDAEAWRGTDNSELVANTNDIVEYNGTKWTVIFDASGTSEVEYVTNLTTSIQYRWDGMQWLKSYEGLYPGGEWSLVL
jgi:hypothetical protein